MIVSLRVPDQFGPNGPKQGDIGEAVTFVIDPDGEIMLACTFAGYTGVFWCPPTIITAPILRR